MKLNICEDYLKENGCNKKRCQSLHICPKFLFDLCDDDMCDAGHDLSTNQNLRVLKDFHVEDNDVEDVKKLLKRGTVVPDLCQDFNLGECCNHACNRLHLCADYVMGACRKCNINHNPLNNQCKRVLKKANIKLQQTPKDLKLLLKKRCDNLKYIVTLKALQRESEKEDDSDENEERRLKEISREKEDDSDENEERRPKEISRKKGAKLELSRSASPGCNFNEDSPVQTNSKPKKGLGRGNQEFRLAEKMKKYCDTKDGYIYEVKPKRTKEDSRNLVRKLEISDNIISDEAERVLMIVGATGAGKSTLINGIVNYAYGVEWDDNFRFKVIREEGNEKFEAQSQTKWISAYVIPKQQGIAIPYTLTVIDTPGFGDTAGIKKDGELKNQIREFFSCSGQVGVDHLDGIGFVVQASQARLTPSQKYVFDCVLSLFGNDVKDSIFLLATFADNQTPPVLTAVKEASIPCQKVFKFNNSALFAKVRDDELLKEFDQAYWKMGMQSFQEFFQEFKSATPVSITLTKEVLHKRRRLEEALHDIKLKLDAALDRLELLREACATRQPGLKKLRKCPSPQSSEKEEEEEAPIPWSRLKRKNPTSPPEEKRLLKKLTRDFNKKREKVFTLVKEAHECKQKLDAIALKPDPLGFTDYIDMLIHSEQFENRPGYMQRIKYLDEARAKAELTKGLMENINPSEAYKELDISDFDPSDPTAFGSKNFRGNTADNMTKKERSFGQPRPDLKPKTAILKTLQVKEETDLKAEPVEGIEQAQSENLKNQLEKLRIDLGKMQEQNNLQKREMSELENDLKKESIAHAITRDKYEALLSQFTKIEGEKVMLEKRLENVSKHEVNKEMPQTQTKEDAGLEDRIKKLEEMCKRHQKKNQEKFRSFEEQLSRQSIQLQEMKPRHESEKGKRQPTRMHFNEDDDNIYETEEQPQEIQKQTSEISQLHGGKKGNSVSEDIRLAVKMKESWKNGDGFVYEVSPKNTKEISKYRLAKYDIGDGTPDGVGKVLMLVGATGAEVLPSLDGSNTCKSPVCEYSMSGCKSIGVLQSAISFFV
ncbi:unnamed protein product [Darwinula stevensoni]|uniref:Septin-type G domain-containing protein n=1 Tax=Darwinula stevensoni TaxID=69355 RepID=A0A7R8X7C5_9CRUS|nr:unnamed protein product [Darwinula stevensoni]CAG0887783.1 unnamed protein product [Darwinula stevensoni]